MSTVNHYSNYGKFMFDRLLVGRSPHGPKLTQINIELSHGNTTYQ